MYSDPDFPTDDSTLPEDISGAYNIVWKRPKDICDDPRFFVGGSSRFDVRQGALGDCWLLAAVASLSMNDELFGRVVPKDQDFTDADYCGKFRFNFWQFGEWTEVCVDDLLPTYEGSLVFMKSTDSNEFWSALLEKAYAKVMGSYSNLIGGSTSEAMEDFTGGITEFYDLRQNPPSNLFQTMLKAVKRCSLMGCSIEADPNQTEARLENGLIMGHAYSITDVRTVEILAGGKSGKIPLVRVRNPWGNEEEWKGAWGDSSGEWKLLADGEREKMGLTFDDDGEFWMSFQDFMTNFEKMEICHLGPDSMNADSDSSGKRRWEAISYNNCWIKHVSAGGCRKYLETFWTNPQFHVKVVDPDEDDDEDMGSIIVGLMQKGMRKKGMANLYIGYIIYALKSPDQANRPLELDFFKFSPSKAKSTFVNTREVCTRHGLVPGDYVIVPSTFDPAEEGEFLLRIYSEKPNESSEVDEETVMIYESPSATANNDTSSNSQKDSEKKPTKKSLVPTAPDEMTGVAKEAFNVISDGRSGIGHVELKELLDLAFQKDGFAGFTPLTCQSLLILMDSDKSGEMGESELLTLWCYLRLWDAVFKAFDKDKSGTFDCHEMRVALNYVGYRLSNKVYQHLVPKYASDDGQVTFDSYILCCARLRTIFERFQGPDGAILRQKVTIDDVVLRSLQSL